MSVIREKTTYINYATIMATLESIEFGNSFHNFNINHMNTSIPNRANVDNDLKIIGIILIVNSASNYKPYLPSVSSYAKSSVSWPKPNWKIEVIG